MEPAINHNIKQKSIPKRIRRPRSTLIIQLSENRNPSFRLFFSISKRASEKTICNIFEPVLFFRQSLGCEFFVLMAKYLTLPGIGG